MHPHRADPRVPAFQTLVPTNKSGPDGLAVLPLGLGSAASREVAWTLRRGIPESTEDGACGHPRWLWESG